MIFSENRFPLFRIMLLEIVGQHRLAAVTPPTQPSDRTIRAPKRCPDGRRAGIFKEIRIEALGLGKF
jgi:hypothetical protein